ncbi:putative O-methylsterigmatocystin oxidoreductase [Xylaria sp. FL1777]|nr:putative O-methylsterigmatocystin oxidoreductase [Xylaria sp. FL1777]
MFAHELLTFFNATVVLAVGFGALIAYLFAGLYLQSRGLLTIPGPDSHLSLWGRSTLPPDAPEALRELAGKFGEVFKLRIGWYNWVVINSPGAFKEIFDKQVSSVVLLRSLYTDYELSLATSSKIPAPIGHDLVTGGLRMFTMPYGTQWRTHRAVMHRLLAPRPTLEFVPSQVFESKHLLFQLAFENEKQCAFLDHVRRMSFSIVTTSAYGRRIKSQDYLDLNAAGETSKLLGRTTRPGAFIEDDIPLLAGLPQFLQPSRRKAKKYAAIVSRGKMQAWNQLKSEIRAGLAIPSFGRDLAESDLRSQGLTDEDAAWIIGGLVEAGAEITSVVIQNLILYLTATPEAQRKAHEELDEVVGRSRLPTFEDITNLAYIRACGKEILRLCPVPTWAIKHYSDAEVTYKHHRIPKGTVFLANTSTMHWDPEIYPQPHVFQPERYLNHPKYSAEYATMTDPYKRDHFTFGGGRRFCPASRLAENTLNITVANMLWAFQLRPPIIKGSDGIEIECKIDTSNHAFQDSAFRGPKPFHVRFIPRSQAQKELIRREWESARTTGYTLRGHTIGETSIK